METWVEMKKWLVRWVGCSDGDTFLLLTTLQQVGLFLSYPIPLSFSKVRAIICPIQLMKTQDMEGHMGKPMAGPCCLVDTNAIL